MKCEMAWHRDCLKNQRESLSRKIKRHEEEAREIEQWTAEVEHYQLQINAAAEKGMDGFDRDKFMKPKRR